MKHLNSVKQQYVTERVIPQKQLTYREAECVTADEAGSVFICLSRSDHDIDQDSRNPQSRPKLPPFNFRASKPNHCVRIDLDRLIASLERGSVAACNSILDSSFRVSGHRYSDTVVLWCSTDTGELLRVQQYSRSSFHSTFRIEPREGKGMKGLLQDTYRDLSLWIVELVGVPGVGCLGAPL
jgi:hypothetical protein